MQNKEKNRGFSSLILKIIAIITMTIDHIGSFMIFNDGYTDNVSYILKLIGRLSLPLIIFILLESLRHTKSIGKFLLRLGFFSIATYAFFVVFQKLFEINLVFNGNIFFTLFLLSLSYVILKSKHKWPIVFIALFFILSAIFNIEYSKNLIQIKDDIFFYINGIYPQYELMAPLIFFLALIFYSIYDSCCFKSLNKDYQSFNEYKATRKYQKSRNFIYIIVLIFIILICYGFTYIKDTDLNIITNFAIQTWMILATIPIALYNGKLGYKKKGIKFFFYLYYPLHLLIIFIVSLLF